MPSAEDETATPTISTAALVRQTARTPMALRILSPTLKAFPLGSNDDNLERAQARAARIASIRRKSVATAGPASPPFQPNVLNHDQIMDLLNNCLKLASENKINQKNTWELNLIDHLSDIIQTKPEVDDAETNFQKASCTLEAGVKIYSLRVDSLHSEAYKVLGGINRVGREHENENLAEGNHMHDRTEQEEVLYRKEVERRKLSPLSTLETSFEALNIKKFDVAFTVDPLYHKTSAQFDEGGAKGLLLNNLGICGSCRILFDSFEVPEKCILNDTESGKFDMIDLSFTKEYLDQMLINMPKKTDISPTLRDIKDQFGECNHWLHNELFVEEHSIGHSEIDNMDHPNLVGNFCHDASDHDDDISVLDDNSRCANSDFCSHREDIGDYLFHDIDSNIRVDEIVDFLSFGLGFTSKTNAWAGPDYWKYKKFKGSEQVINFVEKQETITKKSKVKKLVSDIDFSKSIDMEFPNIFDPPKNPKALLLPTKRASCNIRLPEDCHYKPESLTKLFLLPEVMCFGKKSRKLHDDSGERNDDFVSGASWEKDSVNNDQCDDENFNSDMDDPGSLVRLPRQVNKVDIHYDKVSKQVDVHALKESLWASIHSSVETFDREGSQTPVSLKQVMHRLWDISPTDSQMDISPHLFFICLLHLANEHTLTLNHHSDFDDVDIIVSDPSFVK